MRIGRAVPTHMRAGHQVFAAIRTLLQRAAELVNWNGVFGVAISTLSLNSNDVFGLNRCPIVDSHGFIVRLLFRPFTYVFTATIQPLNHPVTGNVRRILR